MANFGGAVKACHVLRSRLVENTAVKGGSAGNEANLYGCWLDGNRGAGVIDHSTDAIGCTFGANNQALNGTETVSVAAHNAGTRLINSLFLAPLRLTTTNACTVKNCAYPVSSEMTGTGVVIDGATCIATNVDALLLADGIPVIGQNVAIDRAEPSAFEDGDGFLDPVHDLRGFQRIMNGAMDIGCYEADWSERYANDIGSALYLDVSNVSAAVFEEPLTQKVVLPAGATLTFEWTAAPGNDQKRAFTFLVSAGTLYVSRNGGEPVPYAASVETQEIRISGDQTERFELMTSADGCATIVRCHRVGGLRVIVR